MSVIGKRYARALFELAEAAGTLAQVQRELADLAAAYRGSADLRAVLDNPQVTFAARTAILEDLSRRLGLSSVLWNALRLLAQRHRLAALPSIAIQFQLLADERQGVVRAKVTTASTLSEAFFEGLALELGKATGKRVLLDRQVDPSLLGGVIAQIGDHVIDGSVSGKLDSLQRQLLSVG